MIFLLLIMIVFPKDGISIGRYNIIFPTPEEFFIMPNNEYKQENVIQDQLDSLLAIRTTKHNDSLKQKQQELRVYLLDSILQSKKLLQYPNNDKSILYDLFRKLENAKNKKVRIMHFGDSQIEADRITSYFRNELQKKHSGSGAGLFSVLQVTRKLSVKKEISDNWTRYAGFGRHKDTTIQHRKYGCLLAFSKFSPINNTVDSVYSAWININKPNMSYRTSRNYSSLKLFYGNSEYKTNVRVMADSVIISEDSLLIADGVKSKNYHFSQTPKKIQIKLSGKQSPDFYGISLESNKGVIVDNIPLRGASGIEFSRQDKKNLRQMFKLLEPDLLILEFGGNTIPYVKTKERCFKYGSWFEQQIKLLKQINPDAKIIVIGPGDMSKKEKTEFITYPLLPEVRDALKQAAFNQGCVFWDMYQAMGGENTMPDWAQQDPPLASKDYIHFTVKGSKKIAELFYKTFSDDYEAYKLLESKEK